MGFSIRNRNRNRKIEGYPLHDAVKSGNGLALKRGLRRNEHMDGYPEQTWRDCIIRRRKNGSVAVAHNTREA